MENAFEAGVTFEKFGFLDLDENIINRDKLELTFEYLDSSKNPFLVDIGDLISQSYVTETILSKDWDGNELKDDNSLREYFFNNETGTFDGLKRVTVNYDGVSGAIAYMEYKETQPVVEEPPKEVPEPTAVLGLSALLGGLAMSRRRGSQ